MKKAIEIILGYGFLIFLIYLGYHSCNSKHHTRSYDPYGDVQESEEAVENEKNEPCGFADGNYSATVDYYNPDTEYEATYDLDVDVEDCSVVQINFTNGGWLDNTHIEPGEIDSDGEATIEDDRGRTFTVHIE